MSLGLLLFTLDHAQLRRPEAAAEPMMHVMMKHRHRSVADRNLRVKGLQSGSGCPLVSTPNGSRNNPRRNASEVNATGVPMVW